MWLKTCFEWYGGIRWIFSFLSIIPASWALAMPSHFSELSHTAQSMLDTARWPAARQLQRILKVAKYEEKSSQYQQPLYSNSYLLNFDLRTQYLMWVNVKFLCQNSYLFKVISNFSYVIIFSPVDCWSSPISCWDESWPEDFCFAVSFWGQTPIFKFDRGSKIFHPGSQFLAKLHQQRLTYFLLLSAVQLIKSEKGLPAPP